jgi:hypothetical protein
MSQKKPDIVKLDQCTVLRNQDEFLTERVSILQRCELVHLNDFRAHKTSHGTNPQMWGASAHVQEKSVQMVMMMMMMIMSMR